MPAPSTPLLQFQPMTALPLIRPAGTADVAAIVEIYAHYVRNSTVTFETDPPDATEIARRRADVEARGLPYVAAEVDGAVLGYAYAVPYRPRPAYRFTVEDSIYIHPDHIGRGLGRSLLAALIEACERWGARQMVAVIGGSDNLASVKLHERFGFHRAGLLQSVGFKFGRWLDSVLMQKALGSGNETPPQEQTG
ncbi:MAG TPA: GNAT family N-acetyltransferase [Terriglobales bacterium]|nr:GNAT family N-acetyltransferase [Terriglobales bacterium]